MNNLPTNVTPLNERLIQMLIEEHQAEIRRCFTPRPAGRRTASGVRLLRLLNPWRSAGTPPATQGAVLNAQEIA